MANDQSKQHQHDSKALPPSNAPLRTFAKLKGACRAHFSLRFGLGFVLVLALWPVVVAKVAPQSLAENAMLLNTYLQLGLVTALNFIASIFAVALVRLLNQRARPKPIGWVDRLFGDANNDWTKSPWAVAVIISLPTPLVLVAKYGSDFEGILQTGEQQISVMKHAVYSLTTMSFSISLGWVLLRMLAMLKTSLFGSSRRTDNYLPFENVDKQGIFEQFVNQVKRRLDLIGAQTIDLHFMLYMVTLGFLHLLITRLYGTTLIHIVSPPLVLVLLLLILFLWLCGAAYWLDQLCIPVLPATLLLILLSQTVLRGTHKLDTVVKPAAHATLQAFANIQHIEIADHEKGHQFRQAVDLLEEQARAAIRKRLCNAAAKRKEKPTVAVVVSCPGGGIHAAAWSTYVLEQLSYRYPAFRDSIVVISGVSGGSVGTLFFVGATPEPDSAQAADPPATPAFDLAIQSSLEEIVAGMATDDLYGTIFPPLCRLDRGKRLEHTLVQRLGQQGNDSLQDWGEKARNGTYPIVVFNATDVISGRRVLFDSIPTPAWNGRLGHPKLFYNYRELLVPEKTEPLLDVDIPMAAAVRASATFPYISPLVSLPVGALGEKVSIGDGAYSDNDGIVTALDWIKFLLDDFTEDPPFSKILLLRISPYDPDSTKVSVPTFFDYLKTSFRGLTGPLEALASVRSASQTERARLESILMDNYQKHSDSSAITTRDDLGTGRTSGVKISNSSREDRIVVVELSFETSDANLSIPLNWKLNKAQKKSYGAAWESAIKNQQSEFKSLDTLFQRSESNKASPE